MLGRIGAVVSDLDKILAKMVAVGARLGALNRDLELQVDGMRGAQVRLLGDGAQRSLDTQWLAAREGGVFHALAQTLMQAVQAVQAPQSLQALATAGVLRGEAGPALPAQRARLRQRFAAVQDAVKDVALPTLVAQTQSAEYPALAQSLRQMALLKATMQPVVEPGSRCCNGWRRGALPPPFRPRRPSSPGSRLCAAARQSAIHRRPPRLPGTCPSQGIRRFRVIHAC